MDKFHPSDIRNLRCSIGSEDLFEIRKTENYNGPAAYIALNFLTLSISVQLIIIRTNFNVKNEA